MPVVLVTGGSGLVGQGIRWQVRLVVISNMHPQFQASQERCALLRVSSRPISPRARFPRHVDQYAAQHASCTICRAAPRMHVCAAQRFALHTLARSCAWGISRLLRLAKNLSGGRGRIPRLDELSHANLYPCAAQVTGVVMTGRGE